ncbi:metallopeptidase family protein [bacterium]|nr:metallopeptidase family protein [bacterium]
MEDFKFEELIEKYLSVLPEKFKERLKNIGVVVDYENYSHKDPDDANPNELTLGLYQGLPNTEKPGHYRNLPDKITIFKKSLESVSTNDEELAMNLKKVLLHEIGHYFGIDEKKLKELGY